MKTTKKKVVKKVELYHASIKLLTGVFTSEGATVKEAVENLKITNVKGKAILSIEKGGKRQDKIFPPPVVFRLFSASKLMREIALKQVVMRFDL